MRARGCSCSAHAHARVPLTLRRQVRKHKAASDNTSGLYVIVSSFPPALPFVAAKRFVFRCARVTVPSGTRKCSRERGAPRSRRSRAADRACCGSLPCSVSVSVSVFVSVSFFFLMPRGFCEPRFFLGLTRVRVRAATATASRGRRVQRCPAVCIILLCAQARRFTPQQRRPSRMLLAPAAASHPAPPVQVEFHVSRDNGQSWGYASTEHRFRCRSLRSLACLLLASDDSTVQRGGAVGA